MHACMHACMQTLSPSESKKVASFLDNAVAAAEAFWQNTTRGASARNVEPPLVDVLLQSPEADADTFELDDVAVSQLRGVEPDATGSTATSS